MKCRERKRTGQEEQSISYLLQNATYSNNEISKVTKYLQILWNYKFIYLKIVMEPKYKKQGKPYECMLLSKYEKMRLFREIKIRMTSHFSSRSYVGQ